MAIDTLVEILQHYSTSSPLVIKIRDPIIQGVRQISNTFKTMYPIPAPVKPITSTLPPPIIKQPILPSQTPDF